jgi:hypothetical protein
MKFARCSTVIDAPCRSTLFGPGSSAISPHRDMTASPMDTVAGLWGGELPAIDNLDALNELLRVLLMGLRNRLARHQNRNAPFRMIRVDAPETREGLANLAAIRREEVIGLIEGMFGKEQGLALPERVRRALEALAEAGGLLRGVSRLRVIRESLRRMTILRRLDTTSAS